MPTPRDDDSISFATTSSSHRVVALTLLAAVGLCSSSQRQFATCFVRFTDAVEIELRPLSAHRAPSFPAVLVESGVSVLGAPGAAFAYGRCRLLLLARTTCFRERHQH